MVNFVNLRKTASSWEFDSEEALEGFVWANLAPLFGLTPLKRQHIVKGQFCDILALGENNELVVLELKNAEDRYIEIFNSSNQLEKLVNLSCDNWRKKI